LGDGIPKENLTSCPSRITRRRGGVIEMGRADDMDGLCCTVLLVSIRKMQ
jgi:hypothetical protein